MHYELRTVNVNRSKLLLICTAHQFATVRAILMLCSTELEIHRSKLKWKEALPRLAKFKTVTKEISCFKLATIHRVGNKAAETERLFRVTSRRTKNYSYTHFKGAKYVAQKKKKHFHVDAAINQDVTLFN